MSLKRDGVLPWIISGENNVVARCWSVEIGANMIGLFKVPSGEVTLLKGDCVRLVSENVLGEKEKGYHEHRRAPPQASPKQPRKPHIFSLSSSAK